MGFKLVGADVVQKNLDFFTRNLPEATAAGLNRTVKAVEQHELVEMERAIDKPTPFTLNAFVVWKAKPRAGRLNAQLRMRPLQAKYLRVTIEGGNVSTITPTKAIRLSKYGNIPGKKGGGVRSIAARGKRRFVAEIKGVYGVWERYGRGGSKLRLLAKVEHSARREKRFDFYGIGHRVARQRMVKDVEREVRKLLS